MIKLNNTKHSTIAWCVLNHKVNFANDYAKFIFSNLSNLLVGKIYSFGFDVIISDDKNRVIQDILDSDFYTHIVFVKAGVTHRLTDDLFFKIDKLCVDGHFSIIDIDYVTIINLDFYRKKIVYSNNEPNIVQDIFYLDYHNEESFFRKIGMLHSDHLISRKFYSAINLDTNYEIFKNTAKPIDQIITTGGIHDLVFYLNKFGFHKNTTVTFTDVNTNLLCYMKKLIEEWDGNNYIDFYYSEIQNLPSNPIPLEMHNRYLENENYKWNKFISTIQDWPVLWQQIKSLKYSYEMIDYTADYNLDFIRPNENTIVNCNGVFSYSFLLYNLSLDYRIFSENKLIKSLREIDPNIILTLTSRSSTGFDYKNQTDIIDTVSNIEIIDTSKLCRINWGN
jgi:hypothetical protein